MFKAPIVILEAVEFRGLGLGFRVRDFGLGFLNFLALYSLVSLPGYLRRELRVL